MSPLGEVLRRGLERLVRRRPDALQASSALDAVFDKAGKAKTKSQDAGQTVRKIRKGATDDALLAAAGEVLVNPDFAVAAGGCLRPAVMHVLSVGLDALLAGADADASKERAAAEGKVKKKVTTKANNVGDGMTHATRHERACAALGALLELLPHVKPIVARYLRATEPPFARITRASLRGGQEGTDVEFFNAKNESGAKQSKLTDSNDDPVLQSNKHVLLVVRACVRLLRQFDHEGAGGGDGTPNRNGDDDENTRVSTSSSVSSPLSKWDMTPLVRLLRHDTPEVRWTVAMALETVFGLPPDAASRLKGKQTRDDGAKHLFAENWNELNCEIELERAAAFLDTSTEAHNAYDTEVRDAKAPLPGSLLPAAPGHARVGGVEVRVRLEEDQINETSMSRSHQTGETEVETATRVSTSRTRRGPPMVRTASAVRNVEATALALCQNRPLLLEGPAGSGKSIVLEEVASRTNNDDFVVLHLDAQTDSKSLLGSYVIGSTPGEFNWKPGALTQAVKQGRWVVIEDVDQAPFEVLAALVPLLEERKLYVPGRGESIPAAEGFQLFGTVTTGAGRSGGAIGASSRADPLAGLWARVAVEPPRGDEPSLVLTGAHPKLSALAPLMLKTLNCVQRMCGQGGATAAPGGVVDVDEEEDVDMDQEHANTDQAAAIDDNPSASPGVVRAHAGRPFTLRDLLRWARRLERLRAGELSLLRNGISTHDHLPPKVKVAAYEEAADVLCGMLPSGSGQRKILQAVGAIWGLTVDDCTHRDSVFKPAMRQGNNAVGVGRATLPAERVSVDNQSQKSSWSNTGHAMRILERVATAVQCVEPVLLVGETGTGKTALVQQLATLTGAPLTVVNLSNQSESSDFLGGFKPAGARHLCLPLLPRFRKHFDSTFPTGANDEFLTRVQRYAEKRKWTHLLHAFRVGVERVAKLAKEVENEEEGEEQVNAEEGKPQKPKPKPKRAMRAKGKKVTEEEDVDGKPEEDGFSNPKDPKGILERASKRRRRALPEQLVSDWKSFERDLSNAERAVSGTKSGPVFAFVEGALVTALREGQWILLDEINLAPAETLERLSGVLESAKGSLVLSERGDGFAIQRHARFRIFGAMNPATDIGKRDLPAALKHRFTEVYAGECEGREDLSLIVANGLRGVPAAPVDAVVDFYLAARFAARNTLNDSADQKPQYSLRTLTRAMEYVRHASPVYGLQRALYDGFAMSFQTLLKRDSYQELEVLMVQHLLRGVALKAIFKAPSAPPGNTHELVEQYWVEGGPFERVDPETSGRYIVTPNVRTHLSALARAALLRRHPILLQGPTSSGKTSLVEYLAERTGHKFVRINNHEHTDLQEYLGTYVTDAEGKLTFQEGALVQAVRKGWWIVLDELNLAPSDVLEALNRLLDDNRELFVPELQETIKPHPHFALFATQNPPGVTYGGRKVLSKAFRNRFMEIHVGDIPEDELRVILNKRCGVAPSYATKIVEVMRELQRRRSASKAFAGKDGFVTARDLFRWANRQSEGYDALAQDGFRVLGERVRSDEERDALKQTLVKVLKAKESFLNEEGMYLSAEPEGLKKRLTEAALNAKKKADEAELHAIDPAALAEASQTRRDAVDASLLAAAMAWTPAARRLFSLVETCLAHKEPALLVGETGCGKTSIVQLLALLRGQKLRILNCHQHTETGDFLGGFRPTRRSAPEEGDDEMDENNDDSKIRNASLPPFAWEDGPLVQAMRDGDILLVDELSLAEDSVLERLNSVLEPGRTLTLPEKGGSEIEELKAHPNFLILATMNPGGDFGKKELSPALRNRFCEIWIGASNDEREMAMICAQRLPASKELQLYSNHLAQFWSFYRGVAGKGQARGALLTRDLVAWAQFIKAAVTGEGSAATGCSRQLSPEESYVHGAYLTLLDGLGLGLGLPEETAKHLQNECKQFLERQLPKKSHYAIEAASNPGGGHSASSEKRKNADGAFVDDSKAFGVAPFAVPRGLLPRGHAGTVASKFELEAPSARRNAARVLRAMQLPKPILLEGSPGVGKTSLISALAKASGHILTRINLSEQTDMMDLLGADLPADGGAAGEFRWADGAFLSALRRGDWVLLDELNLAPQPVLEGLNAALDHRAEVFVPELGETFRCPPTFRVFAAQNPVAEGGGRKGLPKSFLNRFTRVHVEAMEFTNMVHIVESLFPTVPCDVIKKAIKFVTSLSDASKAPGSSFARLGAPFEFNLRDVLRWLELAVERVDRLDDDIDTDTAVGSGIADPSTDEIADETAQTLSKITRALDLTHSTLFSMRLRNKSDRADCLRLFEIAFGQASVTSDTEHKMPSVTVTEGMLNIGGAVLRRANGGSSSGVTNLETNCSVLRGQTRALESAAYCASRGWMCILVGPPSSGKTSVARTLASLSGRTLRQVALTAATDTSELLGSFEQKEPARDRAALEEDVLVSLREVASSVLDSETSYGQLDSSQTDGMQSSDLLVSMEESWHLWSEYQVICDTIGSSNGSSEDASAAANALRNAIESLSLTRKMLRTNETENDAMDVDGDDTSDAAKHEFLTRLASLGSEAWGSAAPSAGRFEWVDGILLKAATHGEWVLLENANLCSPTVLDRLNPLLEDGGSLLVSECGMRGGEPRVVRAHKDFRLFLALDPRRGEVSRAMRNRGVEVFMSGGDVEHSNLGNDKVSKSLPSPLAGHLVGQNDDLLGVLAAAGVPAGAVRDAMARAHVSLITGDTGDDTIDENSEESTESKLSEASKSKNKARLKSTSFAQAHFGQITIREASIWGRLTCELLNRGVGVEAALFAAWEHVYSRGESSEEAREACECAYQLGVGPYLKALRLGTETSSETNLDSAIQKSILSSVLVEPMGWPSRNDASTCTHDANSTETSAKRAGSLVETVAGVLFGRELEVDPTGSEDSRSKIQKLSNLASVGLPLKLIRQRMELGGVGSDDMGDIELQSPHAMERQPSHEIMDLVRSLRASGHALITGTAHGERSGLDSARLLDVAAWLKRLAARFDRSAYDSELISNDELNLVVPIKPSPVPERDSLGVSCELQSLAVAAQTLARHPCVSVTSTTPHATTDTTWLLALASRGVQAASLVANHCDTLTSKTAVAADVASTAQLSVWFSENPDVKATGQRAHALVDTLAHLFDSAYRFEQIAVGALFSVTSKDITTALKSLQQAQDWRLRLLSLACATRAHKMRRGENGEPPDAATVQKFATTYHLMRGAFKLAADAVAATGAGNSKTTFAEVVSDTNDYQTNAPVEPKSKKAKTSKKKSKTKASTDSITTSPARSWELWSHASSRADAALGVPPGDPPKALLWVRGGRPSVPRFESLRVAEDRTRALCAALRPGSQSVSAIAAQASSLADEDVDGGAVIGDGVKIVTRKVVMEALSSASEASAASVGTPSGAALRQAALEGLCFFAWTHADSTSNSSVSSVTSIHNSTVPLSDTSSDAQQFLEREAGDIPSTIAKECLLLAGVTKGKTETKTSTEEGTDTAMVSGDGGDETIDTVNITVVQPPNYVLPSNALLRSADLATVVGTNNGGVAGSVNSSGPPLGFPAWSRKWKVCADAHDALLPLLEVHSVLTQPQLLSELSLLLVGSGGMSKRSDSTTRKQSAPSAAVLAAIAAGLKFGLENSPRDPSDFQAHRHIMWLADEALKRGDLHDTSAQWISALPALVQSAWRSWHVASWGGGLNDANVAAALAPKRRKSRVEKVDDVMAGLTVGNNSNNIIRSHVVSNWISSTGPARGEGALTSVLSSALLVGAPTGVASRAARILQLRLASRALRLRRPNVVESSMNEWSSLGALVSQIILAHCEDGSTDDLRSTCVLIVGHTSFDKPFKDVKVETGKVDAVIARFEKAASTVDHPLFQQCLPGVLLPLVTQVMAGVSRFRMTFLSGDDTTAFATGESSYRKVKQLNADKVTRGVCWTLLGLLRLNFLLPDGTPDPAANVAARVNSAELKLLNETTPELGVLTWQRSEPTVVSPSSVIISLTEKSEQLLKDESRKLRMQLAPRPPIPKWRPLMVEQGKFRDALASVDRVTSLVKALRQSAVGDGDDEDQHYRDAFSKYSYDSNEKSKSKKSKPDAAECQRARAEASAWLDASAAWEERLEISFRGYRDATEPLRLSVCEMRRGVALAFAATSDPVEDEKIIAVLDASNNSGKKKNSSYAVDKTVVRHARATASAAAAHLMSYPPLALTSITVYGQTGTTQSVQSAVIALGSPHAQKALSCLERVAASNDANARVNNSENGDNGNNASIVSAAKLRVAALRAALVSAEEEAYATGSLSPATWRRCSMIFTSLSSLWAHSRDAELEAEHDANSLFSKRVKGPTSVETLEGDDEVSEELAYERAFGRHGVLFEDLQAAPGGVLELKDDDDVNDELLKKYALRKALRTDVRGESDCEDDDDSEMDSETKARVHAAKLAGLLEGDLLEEVVSTHRRLLGGLKGPPAAPPPPSVGSVDPATALAANNDPSGWWAVSGAKPSPKKYGKVFDSEEARRAELFERAHDAGVKVSIAIGGQFIDASIDQTCATGCLLRTALEHACASRPAITVAEDAAAPRLHLVGGGDDASAADALAGGTGEFGDDDATIVEPHDPVADAAADALGADLNEGGCAGEMALVVAPVGATLARITGLLQEWPDHPLLTQLAEICNRVLQLDLLSPLKQALTGLELLLARAQTWEEGAASHVSLKEELAACAKLALRWRQRELRTWPRLLQRAQERHVTRAHRAWFALHRLLRPPVSEKSSEKSSVSDKLSNIPDDPSNLLGIDASGLTQEEREGLRQVTLALEEYVQGSTIGEFRARLDLLWQFFADLAVEAEVLRREGVGQDNDDDGTDDSVEFEAAQWYSKAHASGAREAALAHILYNTWRYYAQFLPSLQRKVEAARQPAAKKLRDHAKLAKWEDRGYHAMKTSGESNQRSMHKFVRAFDLSLNALALPALQQSNQTVGYGDLPHERSAADRAATAATVSQTALEAKRAAILAKNLAAETERREHKLKSAGESVKDRARRVVAEEREAEELKKKTDADRKKAIADASRKAFDNAEQVKATERSDELLEFNERWKKLGVDATRGAVTAGSVLEKIKVGMGIQSDETISQSLRLSDDKLYQSRLDALTKRVASVLGSSFLKLDDDDLTVDEGRMDVDDGINEDIDDGVNPSITTFARGAVDVDAFASTIAARCVSLRDDPTAKKQTKKKAFVDLLKALPSVGIRSVRKAVPESQRTPEAWFREPPMAKPDCLPVLGAKTTESFDAADSYYYKSMARAQRLRETKNASNGDLSAREIDTITGSVEHLLYLLRKQRRVVRHAGSVETQFTELVNTLRGVSIDVSAVKDDDGKIEKQFALPPPQAPMRQWTLRQRSLLDKLLSATKAAKLVHKAVSHCESTPELRPGGDGSQNKSAATLVWLEGEIVSARTRLDQHVVPALRVDDSLQDELKDSKTAENAWTTSTSFFATNAFRKTVTDNYVEIEKLNAKVCEVYGKAVESAEKCNAPSGDGNLKKSFAALPGWEPLRALLENGRRDYGVFAQTMEGHGASVKNETHTDSQTSLVETLKQHASSFSTSVESCVNSALVWAQTVKRAADGDEEAKVTDDNNDSTKNDPTPTMVGAEKTLQSAMSVRKLLKVARYAREACESLSQMTDAAHEIGINTSEEGGSDITSVVAAATARAAELFPLLSLLQNAFQRSLGEYVAFHRASAKLEAVLSSLAVGICLEGFCVRPDEQDGGEGDESGKMMDDVAGTGMGEGEGKKDVSDEIEDEEQILGAEDLEKQDEKEDEGVDKNNDDKGIEMQNDFEADAKELSDDEEEKEDGDDGEDEENENGDDIEKEMGDGEDDDNAEVVDEKVWDQEDEDEEKDNPPEEKQKEQDKYEKGSTVKKEDALDTETRAAEEDDKDDRKDTDKESKDDKKEKDKKDTDPPDDQPDEDPNDNDEPKDENDGVNQEEVEENHGIVPKGADENENENDDDELELPDDMQLDGEDEAGGVEGDEPDEVNDDDGEKDDNEVDEGQGEQGDGGEDDNDLNEDENQGGELDQVMEEVDNEDDDDETKDENDDNAGGAADDDAKVGEDDEGVQGGPSGAGAGGGTGEDDKTPNADAGDQGGDAGAGAEGEGEDDTAVDQGKKAPPQFNAGANDFDGGDDDNGVADQHQSALEAPGGGGEGGGGASASAAGEGAAAPLADGAPPPMGNQSMPPPPRPKKPEGEDSNPHRSLGDALKGWKERLSVIGDAVERPDANVGEKRDADDDASELPPAREYEFERDSKDGGAEVDEDEGAGEGAGGGVQALAGATKEQAADAAASGLDRSQNPAGEGTENENEIAMEPGADTENVPDHGVNEELKISMNEENNNEMDVDTADATGDQDDDDVNEDVQDPNKGKSAEERGIAKARRKGKNVDDKKPKNVKENNAGAGVGVAEDDPGDDANDIDVEEEHAFGGRGELGEETVVTLKQLEDVTLADGAKETEEPVELSAEQISSARAEAIVALGEWRERTGTGVGHDHLAQQLWTRLELLTGALSGELAEQLRLILEPTLASRLTGDFRTGKRLNMRKIIPYIASDYRKDKIWLRRSKPSHRKYQVVLAIDDSKSMTENQCGHLALESTVLIARAMSRLEVGEIGVVSFGADGGKDDESLLTDDTSGISTGAPPSRPTRGGIRTLHPLGAPFTDQGGPALVSQFTFAQDNTLADQPVVGLLKSLDTQLTAARENLRGGSDQLQQLCLIIADGRFHEKEALRKQMREMQSRRGVLVAFIVLDNPKSSVLDMQTVSFQNGKPNFTKYLDTFPFPFYTLVQDIAKLPSVISDLLRQWFEITAGG